MWLAVVAMYSSPVVQAEGKKLYVINIASSLEKFDSTHLPDARLDKKYHYYTVKFKYKNQLWNRLRLGFFVTREEAAGVLGSVKKTHSDAFIGVVSDAEVSALKNNEVYKGVHIAEYLVIRAARTLIDAVPSIELPKARNREFSGAGTAAENEPDHYYVVNLKTSSKLSDFDAVISHPVVARNALYISELEIDKRIWYQFRAGFFVDKKQAEQALNALLKDFPLARILQISKQEKQVATSKIRAYASVASPQLKMQPKQVPPQEPGKVYQALIKKGTSALSAKDYKTAIQAFREILSYPENQFSMDAQELLGFSYELDGQVADARREYERYISLYPESSGANRVRQRLASLITARSPAPRGLQAAEKKDIVPEWQFFGSISQFYRRDTSTLDIDTETSTTTINTTDKRVNISEIDSIVSVSGRRRSSDYDMRTRFTGGHVYDLLNDQQSNLAPINELYFDILDVSNNINGRIGRQSSSKGGVLGRFDGLDMGYQVSDWFKINMTTGYQVTSVYHSADTDAFFGGVRADFGTFLNAWDFSLYYIKQHEGDVVGREAVGTEFRYFHPRRSLFGLIDHDILFDITNTILLNGSLSLTQSTSLNATVDIRQSPILTARNALQGQPFVSVEEMLTAFSEEEILQIAQDRTAETKTCIIGISHTFTDQYTLNADLTSTRTAATEASAGIEENPATGTDYYFNTQLVGTSVFKDNDTNIVGLSASETDRVSSQSVLWNYRVPVGRSLRLNPRLSVANRDNVDGSSQNVYGVAFKMDYRWSRNTSLDLELSAETSDKTLVTGEEKNKVYFINAGYQYNF
jgi:tetratricopeptide (TPR) repeat protein